MSAIKPDEKYYIFCDESCTRNARYMLIGSILLTKQQYKNICEKFEEIQGNPEIIKSKCEPKYTRCKAKIEYDYFTTLLNVAFQEGIKYKAIIIDKTKKHKLQTELKLQKHKVYNPKHLPFYTYYFLHFKHQFFIPSDKLGICDIPDNTSTICLLDKYNDGNNKNYCTTIRDNLYSVQQQNNKHIAIGEFDSKKCLLIGLADLITSSIGIMLNRLQDARSGKDTKTTSHYKLQLCQFVKTHYNIDENNILDRMYFNGSNINLWLWVPKSEAQRGINSKQPFGSTRHAPSEPIPQAKISQQNVIVKAQSNNTKNTRKITHYDLDGLIADIKSINISNIIGRYCRLTNAGGMRRKACCPFHHEKTPSFYVDDREGYYKCFGCGEGGDVIKFIQQKHSCDFKQAIDLLCEMLGIDKSKYIQQDEQQVEKQATFFETMKVVSEYYKQCLANDKDASDYVLNIRQLSQETIDEFSIGLAKNDIPDLLKYCQEQDINEEAVIESGILRRSIKETSLGENKYLFFRDRIMIPIQNVSGKIVAFGGRVYKANDVNADKSKYLNSSENDNFKKGQILFNLNRAKRQLTASNQLIIVEGYMDAIALWQGGFKTGIAPLGTSITEQHLKTILNYSKNPIFIFDSDNAGKKASMRACEMLFPILQTGIVPRFLTLQGAKDCDEFLHKYSPESLQEQMNNALEINEFLFQQKTLQYNTANPNQRSKCQKEIAELLNRIPDDILRTNYQKYFKDKFWNIDYQNRANSRHFGNQQQIKPQFSKAKTTINKINIDTLEKQIIAVVLQHKDLLEDDALSNNIIARFSQRNQTLLNQMLIEEDNNKITTFCERYAVKNAVNTDTNHKNIVDNLSISWEIQYINRSNLPPVIKRAEVRKVLDKKRKYFANNTDC